MIGVWQQFGQGDPPRDGEAIVYIAAVETTPVEIFTQGYGAETIVAIHRNGWLTDQFGNGRTLPYGLWWTSLPDPSARI